jgi:pyruvate/2-oxoglutarate dehydrogenase complex dihydrolipoamide dehydrogenase (E3) component
MSDMAQPPMSDLVRLEPLDDANRLLLAQVRPADWVNPKPRRRYHLVVVGAGTAGLVSAAGAASLGATVALVERGLMGGDCLNVGCVPSKAIIRAARGWQAAAAANTEFGGPRVVGDGDFEAAMARMRRLRARLSPVDGAARFRQLGVDVFFGDARFVGPTTIAVDDDRLSFRRAVIATGARAAIPPIPGLAAVDYLTNETVFNLTSLPRRLLVLGGGPIGCELGQAFARFGSHVTLICREERILEHDEPEAAAIVQTAMARDGVQFRFNAYVTRIGQQDSDRIVWIRRAGRDERLDGDHLLVAAGRAPNVEDLGLETANISHDHSGVRVDDRLRTTNARVFAAGDICSEHRFTHVADAHARIAIRNALVASALHVGYERASALVVPWCTYTSPELAHVGLTPAAAQERGIALDTIVIPLGDVDRAVLDGADDGLLRLHVRQGTDQIAGATLVAEHAGDLISELTLAMTRRIGMAAIGQTIHPYPTQSDVVRKAADTWRRTKLTPRVRRAFGFFFRIFR